MQVPKASVDKNYLSTPPEDEVGSARQSLIVKPIAKTKFKNQAADRHLRTRVSTPDSPHVLAAANRLIIALALCHHRINDLTLL